MRSISAASLAKLATKLGTEPITLVEIQWTDSAPSSWYAGKNIPGIAEGRILQISAIDDTIDFSNRNTSQSVTVALSDTDGQLLSILGNVDIHRRPIKVWQWFDGIPFSDKFLLFTGAISSPIQWKEGERSLSFTILSRLDDFEVGFAPEEGTFTFVPDALIGKPWPIFFGNVFRCQTIPIDQFPTGGEKRGGISDSMTKDATGIHDPSLDKKIKDNELTATAAAQLANLFFVGYLEASFTARKAGELDDLAPIRDGHGTFSNLAKQFLDQGNKYLLQSQQISRKNEKLQQVLTKQKAQEKNAIGVTNGENFPQGQNLNLNAGGGQWQGYFLGDTFNITGATHPQDAITANMDLVAVADRVEGSSPNIPRSNFLFLQAGTPMYLALDPDSIDQNNPLHPIRYVVASGIPVTVQNVYAYRTVDGLRSLYVVPPQYYQVQQTDYGSLPVTIVYMFQPLSSILGSDGKTLGYENETWVDVVSPIGPNMVEIIKWLIENYSRFTWDAESFANVEAQAAAFPMNFGVFDKPTLIKLVQDIAYQGRTIIYLKDNVFFLKYLPITESPVATITESDVIVNSLEVGTTETEDLITKYVATYLPDHLIRKPWEVILRYNILYYGLHEQKVDYFCYNQSSLVQWSAVFWMIRLSNTYKTLSIKVPFTFLNVESLDTVLLNFTHPFIANTPIVAVVKKATIDKQNYEVTLEFQLPVRLGEMNQYLFYWPAGLSEENVYPTEDDVRRERVGSTSTLNKQAKEPTESKPMSADPGNGGSGLHVSFRPLTWGDGGPDDNFVTPDLITRIDSTTINAVKPPEGVSQYQYDQQTVAQATLTPPTGVTLAGFIDTVNDDGTYDVNVFFRGLTKDPTLIKAIKQVDNAVPLKEGQGIMVSRIVWTDDKGKTQVEYSMQGGSGGNSTFAGIVSESNGDGTYIVDIYQKGAFNPPTTIFNVRQVVGDNDNPLAAGTGVMATRVTFTNDDGSSGVEWTMQAPVWSP
jgi:hypothetical protein